jgi:hypothetical protein
MSSLEALWSIWTAGHDLIVTGSQPNGKQLGIGRLIFKAVETWPASTRTEGSPSVS